MPEPPSLRAALRLGNTTRLAAVGAGGKTTFLFKLAREFPQGAILTASTHLAVEQATLADRHVIVNTVRDIDSYFTDEWPGVTLITGPAGDDDRWNGLPPDLLARLSDLARAKSLPILVEADGSRQLPLKAPAPHEPPIPGWVTEVVVCAGLSALGSDLRENQVHRPELLSALCHQNYGSRVTMETFVRYFQHANGGLKNIPIHARKMALLNQADSAALQSMGGRIAQKIIPVYESVLLAAFAAGEPAIKALIAPSAAIILAAGRSARLEGKPKVLLDWQGQPFIERIARTALLARLDPVIVVTGEHHAATVQALQGLPLHFVRNERWQEGQSTSIQAGLGCLPLHTRSVLFLLGDQPQLEAALLTTLVEEHAARMVPIIAPLVEDRRANPVLFDRITFPDLMNLQGDSGGRGIFSKYPVVYVPWFDGLMRYDVDTVEDYQRLQRAYANRFDA